MSYEDVMMIEGVEGHETEDAQTYYSAIQRQINAGQWSLQGSQGRAMMDAITTGFCLCGPTAARDFYGNVIPGRHDVKAGTKGSKRYVEMEMGLDWADAMEAL